MEKLIEKIEPIMGKLSANKIVICLRNSFTTLIPVLMLSGFATLFGSVLFNSTGYIGQFLDVELSEQICTIFTRIGNGCLNIFSILLTVLIPYNYGKMERYENPIMLSLISLSVFFVLMPLESTYTYFGTQGIILSFIVSFSSAYFFMKLAKIEKLKINLGNNIPSGIAEVFNLLFVFIIEISAYAVVVFLINLITGMEIGDLITAIIQAPLVSVTATLPGVMLYCSLVTLVFCFGIHGSTISSLFQPIMIAAIGTGAICNESFKAVFGFVGGTGGTLGLVLVMAFMSKRNEIKQIGKMSLLPSLFNINEPVLFGLPVVFNPIMIICVLITTNVNLILAYIATSIGLIGKLTNFVAWSTPIFLKGYLASNGDIRVVIFEAVLVIVDVMIALFFYRIYERTLNKQQNMIQE